MSEDPDEHERGQPTSRTAWRDGDPVAIPGDYQHRALSHGMPVQRFWHSRKLDLIRRVAMPRPGLRALDVGCGSGVVANFLAEHGAVVDAVDANEHAIRFAREQFGSANLTFHLGLANAMDFADGTFERIVCMEVVEHLTYGQAEDLVRNLGRLLAPDGELLVTTPNYRSLWPAIERLMDLFHLSPPMQGEQHVTHFTRRRLRAMLARAGLEVRRCGRFCGLAPFASVLSWRVAEWADRGEWRLGSPLGNILYAVAGATQ